jgi:hypothetical protein
MFCPTCGRDNPGERKFCASCGTNLEAVSQALTGARDDFFTKTDAALDQLIARYADHVFKDSPSKTEGRKVGNSWRILGRGVATTFVDLILFTLMWNVLPLRFLILLISTPIRLLSQRSGRPGSQAEASENNPARLAEPMTNGWRMDSFSSVSENTTQNLEEHLKSERKRAARRE